jgi:hypothetical protein
MSVGRSPICSAGLPRATLRITSPARAADPLRRASSVRTPIQPWRRSRGSSGSTGPARSSSNSTMCAKASRSPRQAGENAPGWSEYTPRAPSGARDSSLIGTPA